MPESCASIRIVPVTDVSEVDDLAQLCDLALRPDPMHAFLEKYSGSSVYDDTTSKLTAAILDTANSKVFKAVRPTRDADGRISGELVGMSQWYVGYCVVPKIDPFAIKNEDGRRDDKGDGKVTGSKVPTGSFFAAPDIATPGPGSALGEMKLNPASEMVRKIGNAYVSAIRGKKHVYLRRMMVHPDYQRQGIGQKLIQWGLDIADEQKIVSWLNSRPAGRRLYEKAGFRVVAMTETGVEGMDMAPTASMLRLPRPKSSVSQV